MYSTGPESKNARTLTWALWLVFISICMLCRAHALPPYMTDLWDVIEFEIGEDEVTVPPYRCSIGAHRGASVEYLENTLLALKTADQNPRYAFIEFDVQYSKDHQIVVFHDQRLFRLFRHLGAIDNLTYEQLHEISNGEIALYGDVMDVLKKKVNIEIKSQGDEVEDRKLADEIIADLEKRKRTGNVMISSISGELIAYINQKYPQIPTGQIYWLTSSTYLHLEFLTERLYKDFNQSQADYLMLHVANFRNIHDLLALKPKGKTIMFWDFDDHMYLVHQSSSDRVWGNSILSEYLEKLRFYSAFPKWNRLFQRDAQSDYTPISHYRPSNRKSD